MVGAILIVLVLLALAAACAVRIPRLFGSFQTQLAERNAEFDRRLESVGAAVDRRLAELDTKVDRRLENASQTTVKIHERLGTGREAAQQNARRGEEPAR